MDAPKKQHRKPIKPTAKEHRERIEFCIRAILAGYRVGQIKQKLREKYSPIHTVSLNRYLFRARKEIAESVGANLPENRERHLAEGVQRLLEIVHSENAKASDKISAQKVINDMLGLNAPKELHHSGAIDTKPGECIPVEIATQWSAFDRAAALAASNGHSEKPGEI